MNVQDMKLIKILKNKKFMTTLSFITLIICILLSVYIITIVISSVTNKDIPQQVVEEKQRMGY